MEIVNKNFTRTGSNDVFKVTNIDNGFVMFENGSQCKMDTFMAEFTEAAGMNENYSAPVQSYEPNPDTFFNSSVSENDPILNQLEQLARNPNLKIAPSIQVKPSIDLSSGKPLTSGSMTPEQERLMGAQNNQQPVYTPAMNNAQEDTNVSHAEKPFRLPEWDIFDRTKKSEEVEFMIPLRVKLPKAATIQTMNDMFETSIVSYLAKQFIADLLKNDKSLLLDLNNKIEKWVDSELSGTKPAASKSRSKKAAAKTETETVQATPAVAPDSDISLNSNFKLDPRLPYVINDEDDLAKIQKEIEKLNDKPMTREVDMEIDRLENLIIAYKNK